MIECGGNDWQGNVGVTQLMTFSMAERMSADRPDVLPLAAQFDTEPVDALTER